MDALPINWNLISSPVNWAIILLMLMIAGFALHLILPSVFSGGKPPYFNAN